MILRVVVDEAEEDEEVNRREANRFEAVLRAQRAQLKGVGGRMRETAQRDISEGDHFDQAAAGTEKIFDMTLSGRDAGRLAEIEDALGRIADGEFGLCEECGGRIPVGRLEVMPAARYCLECQGAMEA